MANRFKNFINLCLEGGSEGTNIRVSKSQISIISNISATTQRILMKFGPNSLESYNIYKYCNNIQKINILTCKRFLNE
jgi:hypothetical protein